jgi:RNA polymerase sigma-70 factor, ECF subfamily
VNDLLWLRDGGPRVGDAATHEEAEVARKAVEAVARRSYGRLVALLAARTRDVAGAEDALSDAFVAALVDWPAKGIPRSPEAWLVTVARRKWIDAARRRRRAEDASGHLRLMADEIEAAAAADAKLPDERLALMFACAHPAIDPGIRAPLILQTILGLDAAAIGSAFLVSPAAMAQRLVRAKRKIREAGIPFHVPEGPELAARLDAVLEAISTAFAEGGSDATGPGARRRNLVEEAIWLGRLVVWLLPEEPAARRLLSLMLHSRSLLVDSLPMVGGSSRRSGCRVERSSMPPSGRRAPAGGSAPADGRRPSHREQCPVAP